MPTAAAVAVKLTLQVPAATVTEAGTVTALLLLRSRTVNPLFSAGSVNVTVHASVAAPVIEPLLQVNASRPTVLPRLPLPNIGVQHNSVNIAAATHFRLLPIPRFSARCRSKSEIWLFAGCLHCNASSAATARPRGGGTSFIFIEWHL
jgi:hypothetical protein